MLRQALEQLTRLYIPSGVEWELLIVNNGCTDATDRTLDEFTMRLPLRRLLEPKAGLSHARNRAIDESRGQYILWTDDDVLVDERWLASYVTAFRLWPQAVLFGGPIRPHFVSPPPLWLEKAWAGVADHYGMRDLGDQAFRFDQRDRLPHGANFAVRTHEQRQHLYDPALGHRHGLRVANEETVVAWELVSNGYEGWWTPAAGVRHQVTPDRMSLQYIRQSYFDPARYIDSAKYLAGGKPRGSYMREAIRTVKKELKYRYRRLVSPPDVWIQDLIRASIAWGRLLSSDRHR